MTWKQPHSPVKKKCKIQQSPAKVTVTVFWDVYGVLLVDFIPPNSTINATAYQETLKTLKEAIMKETRTVDHTSSSFAQRCMTSKCCRSCKCLNSWSCEILPHLPHSPDLELSDFHLFPYMKKHLRGQQFYSSEDVQNEFKKRLCTQNPPFCYEELEKLIYRCDKCLNKLGDYVEK
jgi:hypothetical protein